MKRIIMLFAVVAGVAFGNEATAQKGQPQNLSNNPSGNSMSRDPSVNRLQQEREARDLNSTAITTMKQDTTRPRRDTMRSPQPVPPVPPVPMPPDTNRKK